MGGKEDEEMKENRHKMLEKALCILELVAGEEDGLLFTDIVDRLEIPKSSAHSLLFTLESMGYLEKKESTKKYRVGLKAFEIGSAFSERDGLYRYVKEILKELVEEVGETAHYATLDGVDVVYLNKYDCSHVVRMISHIGKRVPAHATAIGKAILAAKENEEIIRLYQQEELPVLTENTIKTRTKLIQCLERIRYTGFALEKEESTPGIQCIAVGVKNDKLQQNIAISIAVPISRAGDGMLRLKDPILRAKKKLESL